MTHYLSLKMFGKDEVASSNLASSSKTLKLLEFRGFSCFCGRSQTASFFTQFRERMRSHYAFKNLLS